MKAAHHGSPPLARSNRHSNRSINHLKTKSRLNSYNQIMPPFLRLDSTGEVTAHDRPEKNLGHSKRNTCCQGPETSAGLSRGRNRPSFFGKLFSHLAPQPSTSSALGLLDSSKARDGNHLDELLLNRKPGFSCVPGSEKPSHVKMAQVNVQEPHVNRYGHWRIMSRVYPSYPILPRGVFPCHVIQAQREPRSVWSSSGHFVVKSSVTALACCSLFDAFCSPDSSNSSQRTESDSDSSISIENTVRSRGKVSSSRNRTTARGGFGCSSENKKTCSSKSSDPSTRMDLATCSSRMAAVGLPSCSSTCSTDDRSNHCDTEYCLNCPTATRLCLNCQSQTSGESIACVDEPLRSRDQSSTTQTTSQPQIIHSMSSKKDEIEVISSETEAAQPSASVDDDWDDEGNSDSESCPENTVADGEGESEKQWNTFLDCQFNVSSWMSKKSEKQPRKSGDKDLGQEERRISRPNHGMTAKWLKMYADTYSFPRSPFKVRFKFGEGKDIIHKIEQDVDETMTVMELQKARDQIKQHGQNAAKLLRQKSDNIDDDDDEEDDSDAGAVGGAKAAPKKKCPCVSGGNASRAPVGKDDSSLHKDSQEEDEQEKDVDKSDEDDDDDDDDDDDSVVFDYDDDSDDDDGVVFAVDGVDEESDCDEKPSCLEEEEEEDDESDIDIDIVFEEDGDKKKKDHSPHGS